MATDLATLALEIVATRRLLADAERRRDIVKVAEHTIDLALLIGYVNELLDGMNAAKVPA